MVEEVYCHSQGQGCILGVSVVSGLGSFGKVWFRTFGGRMVRSTSHEKTRMANHGAGLSWGMSLRVVGRHHSLA